MDTKRPIWPIKSEQNSRDLNWLIRWHTEGHKALPKEEDRKCAWKAEPKEEWRTHSDDIQNAQQAVDTVPWVHVLHDRFRPILKVRSSDSSWHGEDTKMRDGQVTCSDSSHRDAAPCCWAGAVTQTCKVQLKTFSWPTTSTLPSHLSAEADCSKYCRVLKRWQWRLSWLLHHTCYILVKIRADEERNCSDWVDLIKTRPQQVTPAMRWTVHVHSPGCTARDVHPGPRRCCRHHFLVWRELLPPAAQWTPCGDTAQGTGVSRNVLEPWSQFQKRGWGQTEGAAGRDKAKSLFTWRFSACRAPQTAGWSFAHRTLSDLPPATRGAAPLAAGWAGLYGSSGFYPQNNNKKCFRISFHQPTRIRTSHLEKSLQVPLEHCHLY